MDTFLYLLTHNNTNKEEDNTMEDFDINSITAADLAIDELDNYVPAGSESNVVVDDEEDCGYPEDYDEWSIEDQFCYDQDREEEKMAKKRKAQLDEFVYAMFAIVNKNKDMIDKELVDYAINDVSLKKLARIINKTTKISDVKFCNILREKLFEYSLVVLSGGNSKGVKDEINAFVNQNCNNLWFEIVEFYNEPDRWPIYAAPICLSMLHNISLYFEWYSYDSFEYETYDDDCDNNSERFQYDEYYDDDDIEEIRLDSFCSEIEQALDAGKDSGYVMECIDRVDKVLKRYKEISKEW